MDGSIDATVQVVSVEEASRSDPNGIDVMFGIRKGEDLVEAFTVLGRLIYGQPHWAVGEADPFARDHVTGNVID